MYVHICIHHIDIHVHCQSETTTQWLLVGFAADDRPEVVAAEISDVQCLSMASSFPLLLLLIHICVWFSFLYLFCVGMEFVSTTVTMVPGTSRT